MTTVAAMPWMISLRRAWALRSRGLASLMIAVFTLTVLPPSLSAAGEDPSVMRGAFIRDVVKALNLPVDAEAKEEGSLPRSLAPSIAVARKRGALSVFGKEFRHNVAITRGQAIWVLMKLSGARAEEITVKFTDVPDHSEYLQAVQVAINKNWMRPVRPKLFGVERALTEREAKLVLSRLKKGQPTPSGDDGMTTNYQTIKISVKKRDGLPKEGILQSIWQLLNDEYLYKDKLNPDEAAYRAAEGMVQSLGDPYTVFFRPATSKQFQTQIKGEVTGIGAQVEMKNGVLLIVSPIKGSPAEKAGLLPGDEIIAVDGQSLAGFSFTDAVDKVRGPKGSTVRLTIRRNGAEFDVSVVRDTVKIPEIEISFQGDIAVVKLHQFGMITDRDLRSLLVEVQSHRPKGLILDLRNNPGGLLHASEVVLSNFLPKGSVFAVIADKNANKEEVTQNEPTILASVPMVVLVNKGSASASEIVAGALQDWKRARILGEQTFGKGTVQQVLQFTDGSSLKVTVAEWLTPKNRRIDGTGIEPDIKVPAGERDEQMLKALELLR